jgi:hypothetical protein
MLAKENALFDAFVDGPLALQRDVCHFLELDAVFLLEFLDRLTHHIRELRARPRRLHENSSAAISTKR